MAIKHIKNLNLFCLTVIKNRSRKTNMKNEKRVECFSRYNEKDRGNQ